MSNTTINTTKIIYPQIYAYKLPTIIENDGWIKIGYTERQNVDERIFEQTHTAAIRLDYQKLWSAPAKFSGVDEWFKDKQFHSYLRKFKKIEQRPNSEWFFYNGNPDNAYQHFCDFTQQKYEQIEKSSEYQLRTEQAEAVTKTLAYIKANPEGEFLWNAKPRFGKTLTTYDLVRQLNAEKVLIVTNRPAIANSWFDDFEQFIAWQTNFAFVSESDALKDRKTLSRDEFLAQHAHGKKKMIAFISLQDLKGSLYFGGIYNKLEWVKTIPWDLLVIDEAHEGVDTLKTDVAFEQITRHFTLHLSGTPFKALAQGTFDNEAIYNWSYADEQAAKANWQNVEENNPYEALPRLNLFSYQISRMITDMVNQGAEIDGENHDYAFDLNEFFETNDKGKFIHEKDVQKWLDTLSRNEKYPFSTPELRNELKHTFWLLNRVASAKALQKLLEAHPVFENYKIILAAGDGISDDENKTTSLKAIDEVKQAVKKFEKTITLSVGQLTTGVTIPEWTAVLMLSNLKSPALYMQAAFRAQNPWSYEKNGQMHQKHNAYVFDFAPERTLIIYDEFANNLFSHTAGGKGTTEDRKQNIAQLINFFPVIAEDDLGKMVELDVEKVLSIPKAIKAQEVVRRGFLSNLLFQNIGGIFASSEVREILEQLNPADEGKKVPTSQSTPIDTQNVQLDENGNATVANEIVIATTDAHFGEKIYQVSQVISDTAQTSIENGEGNLSATVGKAFQAETENTLKEIAKEQGISVKTAEQIAKKSGELVAQSVEKVQKNAEIKRKEVEIKYQEAKKQEPHNIAEIEAEYQTTLQQIAENFQKEVMATVAEQTQVQIQTATQTLLVKAEEIKKNDVEDDIRARLRGFSRTIPAFLMAYGTENTTLANFDTFLNDDVFKEVTNITLDQFRILRDKHHFFDETVFNQSVQEFLNKRRILADYFDENQTEDIFDYIPPQKNNQIFTPKNVVQMMLDKMEAEEPEIFQNPDRTFADLYMKSGLYITEIVKRLYQGLADKIPDNSARLKHILKHQVYGFAPTEIIYHIAKNFILGFDEKAKQINASHIVQCDTVPYAMQAVGFNEKLAELFGEKTMKFDAVVGNPPYQESRENTRDESIYHHFYNLAEQIGIRYCLISPARFLFNAGSTDKDWNQKMLNDEHLKVVYFNQKSDEVFPPPNDIKGGGSSTLQKCQYKI